ncbi:hypothetical protein F8S13_11785 [Chloroflexia bacterium SDU3-3]|nr:hypothetical protein F8S13_11785 [Chloroflexia bacterium SDU3-3]
MIPDSPPTRPSGLRGITIRRPMLLLATAAGLCWASVLAILISPNLGTLPPFAPLRVIFYALVLAAALLTFVPVQMAMRTPGVAFQGACGSLVLLYALAFIPPPTGPIYFLPDLPVYLIFLGGLFALGSALALPAAYLIGTKIFHYRAKKYDTRRAWRQAHEFGAALAACGALAGLRVLNPLSAVVVLLIAVVSEILFLAYVKPPA